MSDDKEFWLHYTRSVAPVTRKKPKPRLKKQDSDKAAVRKSAEKAAPKVINIGAGSGLASNVTNVLERKREKALRDGSFEVDAKLDLHGMTQAQAFDELAEFMHRTVKAGKRHLLIITGKGREGAGVLRNNLQKWLGQMPEAKAVMALRSASARHGGSGAFYVILRK